MNNFQPGVYLMDIKSIGFLKPVRYCFPKCYFRFKYHILDNLPCSCCFNPLIIFFLFHLVIVIWQAGCLHIYKNTMYLFLQSLVRKLCSTSLFFQLVSFFCFLYNSRFFPSTGGVNGFFIVSCIHFKNRPLYIKTSHT